MPSPTFYIPPKKTYIKGVKQYYIVLDDSIDFIQDITVNKDTYTSIFDNPTLAYLKSIHDTYGTVFLMSLFWQNAAKNWVLSDGTDKFKAEFIANSSWLRVNFHSWQVLCLYKNGYTGTDGTYDYSRNAYDDYMTLKPEAIRIFGEECWLPYIGITHWYNLRKTEAEALRAEGWTVYCGHAQYTRQKPVLHLNDDEWDELNRTGFFYDESIDVSVYIRDYSIEKVTGPIKDPNCPAEINTIAQLLSRQIRPVRNMLNVETHETYITTNNADVKQGYVDTAVWANANGYIPKFPDANDFDTRPSYNWV